MSKSSQCEETLPATLRPPSPRRMNRPRDGIAGDRGTRTRYPQWPRLVSLLVCGLGLRCHAARRGPPSRPARPIAAADVGAERSAPSRRGLPFLTTKKSRRAAKEAYLLHLQDELKSARRELCTSQTTCRTLRQRREEQREETLGLVAARAIAGKEERRQSQREGAEIEQLRNQLETETDKCERQEERLVLLAAELNEMQAWKERQEKEGEEKVSQYKNQLRESRQKQSDYAEQVELLTLKLEAAEFAAKQRRQDGEGAVDSTWQQRSQALRAELATVRVKYSKLLRDSLKDEEEDAVGEEMDAAIQTAVGAALEATEQQWQTRVACLEEERDEAVRQAKEAAQESPSTTALTKKRRREANSNEEPTESREELTAELTAALTANLTEKITADLTESLSQKIERKYEKKRRRLRKEFERREERAQAEQVLQQQQLIEAETKRATEECEAEWQAKTKALRRQSEEEVRAQQERMRKLVRALVEREAKARGGAEVDGKQGTAGKVGGGKNGAEKEMWQASSASSRRRAPFSPGVVPARGVS